MNEWFKKLIGTIKEKWAKWSALQKGITIGLIVAFIAVIVILISVSKKDTTARLYRTKITDENAISKIQTRLDRDNVWSDVRNGYIVVKDEKTASLYRSQLALEHLAPPNFNEYDMFNFSQWSRNDFDDNIKWKELSERQVKNLLESLPDIMTADVVLQMPEESIFASNQKPTTASVLLSARPGSDILQNKVKVKALQSFIQKAVEGLTEENISILDQSTGQEVNDFEGLELMDRLNATERENRLILKQETEYSSKVLEALSSTYKDRVRVVSMKIDMDMSKETSTAVEYSGIQIKPDNPNTSYDDSEIVQSLVIGEELINKQIEATGYNPEGPTGVEGQNPPVIADMSNVVSRTTEDGVKRNYVVNEKHIEREESPKIKQITLSVNIDNRWTKIKDPETGKFKVNEYGTHFEYIPIPMTDEELDKAKVLVRNAVGYQRARGDSVEVVNIPFNHDDEWEAEYQEYLKKLNRQRAIMWTLIGIAVVLVAFILFRVISREIERRRRLREEELLRRQQQEREQALWDAKNEGMEVTMSVEERHRAELQENAIAMAKEHPEDVAMLIRTWLMEE